jgi:glyoxylase-like metal-dependent hydrolase (beta-lactamase superfamily II)
MITRWQLFEAGHCRHPEIAVRRDGALSACQFPSLAAALHHQQHGWLLFDTGYASHFLQATTPFPERLYRWTTPVHGACEQALASQLPGHGIDPAQIGHIVLSHLHGDHVAGVADFPRAQVYCAAAAWQHLRRCNRVQATANGYLPALLADVHARLRHFDNLPPATALPPELAGFAPPHDLFGDGSVLLVDLPGHAAGHTGLWFDDGNGPVFLIADATWSSDALEKGVLPPALVTAWLGDGPAYRDTFARLHALGRQHRHVRLVPSHCQRWRPAGSP